MDLGFLYNLDKKKIALIALFLILCVALGFGLYYLFFKSETTTVPPGTTVTPGGSLPTVGPAGSLPSAGGAGALPKTGAGGGQAGQPSTIAAGGLTTAFPIIKEKVLDPRVLESGQGMSFYLPSDNKFYTVDVNTGEKVALSDKSFFSVEHVYWNNNGGQAIISYPDGSKIFYDFSKRQQTSLNKGVTEPDFNQAGQVAYKYVTDNVDNNWLAVTKPDGTGADLIEPIGDKSDLVQVAWSPTNEVVALYSQPTGPNQSEIFFIGLNGENFKSLVVEGSNFKGLWAPDGTKLLYQVVNGDNNYNPMLWMADAYGDNIGAHKFNLGLATWVDKCIFATAETLYCAVPKELREGSGLYPELIEGTADFIYQIDLVTGLKELIAEPIDEQGNNFSVSRLMLTNDKSALIFWDKSTKQVYRVNLR